MNVNDLEKGRSLFAYKKVKEAIEKYPNVKDDKTNKLVPSKQQKEYKAYVKKIPMMILNNGLGATFAFIYSKKTKNESYDLIYSQINEWLNKNYKNGQCNKENECYKDKNIDCQKVDLVEWIICLDSQEYRATTNEILALFSWLKRFAEGMIEGDENGE